LDEARTFALQGVDGFYTDFLTPAELSGLFSAKDAPN
jgi:hypothetical protein